MCLNETFGSSVLSGSNALLPDLAADAASWFSSVGSSSDSSKNATGTLHRATKTKTRKHKRVNGGPHAFARAPARDEQLVFASQLLDQRRAPAWTGDARARERRGACTVLSNEFQK